MSDDTTPSDLQGFRLTLGGTVYEWRLGDTTARHTRALRLATSEPGQPESAWSEARLLHDIATSSGEIGDLVVYGASMEAMACLAFLALLQAGDTPDWDRLLDGVTGDLDVNLEEITTEEVTADPPA